MMNTVLNAFHLGEILQLVFQELFCVIPESTSSIQSLRIEKHIKAPGKMKLSNLLKEETQGSETHRHNKSSQL